MRRFSDPVQVKVQVKAQVEAQARMPVGAVPGLRAGDVRDEGERAGDLVAGDVVAGDVVADAVPEAFIWRGRLYVVRDVLAHWRERRAWWRDALDTEEEQVRPGETLAAAASEQHVWRVEASRGWSFAPGVYDLAHDESARDDRWSLVRVSD